MRFKKRSQLPGAGGTRAGHHHGSHTPTSPEAVLLHKQATLGKHFEPECISEKTYGNPINPSKYLQCIIINRLSCIKYYN